MTDVTPRNTFRKVTPALVWIAIGGILGLILLFSSFFMVDQKEESVVLNFGKFSRIVGPGLHLKIPFGVERNLNIPTQRILKEEFGFEDTTQTELIRGLRRYGYARVPVKQGFFSLSLNSAQFRHLCRQMAAADDRFRQEMVRQYDRNIHILKTARQLAPFDMKFRDLLDDCIINLARSEYEVANSAMVERAAEHVRMMLETNQAELPALLTALAGARGSEATGLLQRRATGGPQQETEQERRENWAQERGLWLKGVRRLTEAVRQYPCNDRLKRSLAEVYGKGLALAEQRQDQAFVDEVRRYTASVAP